MMALFFLTREIYALWPRGPLPKKSLRCRTGDRRITRNSVSKERALNEASALKAKRGQCRVVPPLMR